jgi:hypothetical protein
MSIFVEPYRMVVVNVILLTFALLSLGFVKFVLKKNIPPILIVLIFSLLPVVSILRTGAYESGDFNIHVIRTISFFTSLREGQLVPTWSKDLNATYGYQTFLIGAPLTYYLVSFFHFIGFSFIASMKLFLALSYILSGIFMFAWIKSAYNEKAGLISSLFYLYAPFHLVDLHFRVSPGDMLLYALMPLSAYFVFKLFNNKHYIYFLGMSLSTMLIMLSHPLSLLAISFLTVYILFLYLTEGRNMKLATAAYISLTFGLLFSAYFWLPILLEKKYIINSIISEGFAFNQVKLFLSSPWRMGFLYQGPTGEISYPIGYLQILIIIYSIYLISRKRIGNYERKSLYFFLAIFFLVLFMCTHYSKFIWDLLPILKSVEFSYRLSLISVLILPIICGITLMNKRNNVILFILLLAISQTILNWGHRRVIPTIDDAYLANELPAVTHLIEGGPAATPRWVNPKKPWMDTIPKQRVQFLKGSGSIISLKRTSIDHVYIASSIENAYVRENTYFYPGWELLIDGKKENIIYTNSKYPDIITFRIDKGVHRIELIFKDTIIRKNARIISLISIFTYLMIYLSFFSRRKFIDLHK